MDRYFVINDAALSEAIKEKVEKCLLEDFGIQHSTFEFEELKTAHDGAQAYGHEGVAS